jgi:hypothetical protein
MGQIQPVIDARACRLRRIEEAECSLEWLLFNLSGAGERAVLGPRMRVPVLLARWLKSARKLSFELSGYQSTLADAR